MSSSTDPLHSPVPTCSLSIGIQNQNRLSFSGFRGGCWLLHHIAYWIFSDSRSNTLFPSSGWLWVFVHVSWVVHRSVCTNVKLFLRAGYWADCWYVYTHTHTQCYFQHSTNFKFLEITNLMHFFMYLFISCLCVFRASQRSSSGDRIVLIHHLVWLVCVNDCLVCRSLLTGIPSINK